MGNIRGTNYANEETKYGTTSHRRNLGTFKTSAVAEKHERAVQFFKRR